MLGSNSFDAFVRDTWRRRCQVFERAIDTTPYRLSAMDICELTANDLVESRLIGPDHSLTWGPFEMSDGSDQLLPEGHLLLVHSLEDYFPVIGQLIADHFSFIPRWQIDDVMASIGDAGASCGAHFDHYDVFLVQLSGTKRWQIDNRRHEDHELVEDIDVRLLRDFHPEQAFTLSPGDVLYIPPGAGHFGVCDEQAITLSIGIRNPTIGELLADISEEALAYGSLGATIEQDLHQGTQLDSRGVDTIRQSLDRVFTNEFIASWYGKYTTRLREPGLLKDQEAAKLSEGDRVRLKPFTRMTYNNADTPALFFNGETMAITKEDFNCIETLCTTREYLLTASTPGSSIRCLIALIAAGAADV